MSRRKPGLAANPWTFGPLAAALVVLGTCCLPPGMLRPAWGQGPPAQQGTQQGSKSAPVHIAPGSASTVPGGVTPQQLPPAAGKSGPPPTTPQPGRARARRLPQVPELTANVNLVLVPVVITDPLNRMVTGLEKDFFSITENNVPQKIETFSSEDAPISVGVVFDSSGSMSDKFQ